MKELIWFEVFGSVGRFRALRALFADPGSGFGQRELAAQAGYRSGQLSSSAQVVGAKRPGHSPPAGRSAALLRQHRPEPGATEPAEAVGQPAGAHAA